MEQDSGRGTTLALLSEMVASAHRFELDTIPRAQAPHERSRTLWFGLGFGLGIGVAVALALPDRAYLRWSHARAQLGTALHAYASRTQARAPAPVVAPAAPLPAPPPPPAPRDPDPPSAPALAPASPDTDARAFIGPPEPPAGSDAAPAAIAPTRPKERHVPRGLVTVICRPACDEVRDGARSLGSSPVFKRQLAVGTHQLKLVTNDPKLTHHVTVVVSEGELATVQEEMVP